MIDGEHGFDPSRLGPEVEKPAKNTRQTIEARLKASESLENLDLADLELAGLEFEGRSFRGADVRDLRLYRTEEKDGETIEIKTNIRNTDWLDATFADEGEGTDFFGVSAEGATFGFTESLVARRQRLRASGIRPTAKDCAGYYGLMAGNGDFQNTKWRNVDFGGGAGPVVEGADFRGADLSGATFLQCDLSDIDLSGSKIDGLKIIHPVWLEGLTINDRQISAVAAAIELADPAAQETLAAKIKELGERGALEQHLGIVIVEKK